MTLSNRLADLAERVKEASASVDASQTAAVESAMKAGGLLVEAKAALRHGEWLPFLARAGLGKRQAQRYTSLWKSGLNASSVTHLGGILPTLAFLSNWRMPAFDEMMRIRDPERPLDGGPVGRGAAFIWESEGHRGHYEIGIINGGDDETLVHTKRPMLPMLECKGDRPVDPIIHFLTLYCELPIDAWEIEFIEREPRMTLVLAPFWADRTLRDGAVSQYRNEVAHD
jgi:hypothetical protein